MLGLLARLARHTVIYGLASLASRVASLILIRVLSGRLLPSDYGAIEVLVALSALLVPVLRAGVATGFFRFYFDREQAPDQALVVRSSFTFTLIGAAASLVVGLAAAPLIAPVLSIGAGRTGLVRVAFVMLAAQIVYEQLVALYRVEERSRAFAVASLCNLAVTILATILLVVVIHGGATGALVGNTAGTVAVTVVLAYQRRAQLRLAFDRDLIRTMNRFGLPLLPAGVLVWVVDFSDRFLLTRITNTSQVGLYAVAVKIASVMILVQLAFRTAWPAFAYSVEEQHVRRAFAFVLTYLTLIGAWVSLALGLFSPWLVRLLTSRSIYYGADRVVAPLALAAALLTLYTMLSIGIARSNKTQAFWVVSAAGAAVNVGVDLALIPRYGISGAAIGRVVAYSVLVAGMLILGRKVYPVAYQWRRLVTATSTAVGLYLIGRLTHPPLLGVAALVASYPLLLAICGFYLPAERQRIGSLVTRLRAS